MEAYTSFARVHDMFMDNIPYEEWCGYLTGLLKEQGIRNGLVLDLGCGTGNRNDEKRGSGPHGADNSIRRKRAPVCGPSPLQNRFACPANLSELLDFRKIVERFL